MMTNSKINNLICLLIIALLIVCTTGCEMRFRESEFVMSTIVEITAVGRKSNCQKAIEQAFDEIRRIDGLMNVYNENSEIARINQAAGKMAVEVSADTLEVVERALKYAELTKGALDISVAPIIELWGFGTESNQIPSDEELREKLALVDYKKITVDKSRSTVKLELPGMKINVSGIAKGYAVDRAAQMLKDSVIRRALVNAGGDIYAMSSPPKKDAWRIGVRHPRKNANLLGIVEMKDRAVATSGDYENFFEVDGQRYCHIMNPETGRPISEIMSVTIMANNTAEADALATAIFPMGAANGMKFIENLEGVEGIIVTGKTEDDMEVQISSGMKASIELMTE